MNQVRVDEGELLVTPHGLDRLWGLRRELRIPLVHVRGATYDPDVARDPKGIRAPGLALPGKWVGTFHHGGETTFWSVSDPRDNVVIELSDEEFDRVIATVEDPRATERAINAAVVQSR